MITKSLTILTSFALILSASAEDAVKFKKIKLTDQFLSEGAHAGDFNKDGKMDIVAGWQWFAGPDFKQAHEFTPPPAKPYDGAKSYSDYFLTFVHDFNGDKWDDILVFSWPGKEAAWYENPQKPSGHWSKHVLLDEADNESPQLGDMNGDGKPDILEKNGWWEQPGNYRAGGEWRFHKTPFAPAGLRGGAQMLVMDVNGDGRRDVITSWDAHGYGIAWYEQQIDGEFKEHILVNTKPGDNQYGVQFTQPHAMVLADINGDGLMDFVTGKRFWAHGPAADAEPGAPAVLYWFELKRGPNKTAEYIPHKIDDDSGVGTQITAADLNGDGKLDIISANKKGLSFFIQEHTK